MSPSSLSSLRVILAPIITVVLQMLGYGFFQTFVSIKVVALGYDEWIVGLLGSAYYAGILLGAARAEGLINRFGHIRAYGAFCCIGTATILIQGLTYNAYVWILLRFLVGFCLAVYYLVTESWFLSKATLKTRGAILSLYMTSFYLSQAGSQYILNLIDLDTGAPFFVASLLGVLAAVPLLLTSSPAPDISEPTMQTLRELFNASRFGFIGCVVGGINLSAIYSFSPLYAQDKGISVSVMMSTLIIGGVMMQWPLGTLSDRLDRRMVLLSIAGLTIVPCMMIANLADNSSLILPSAFLVGGLAFTLYPLSITQVCDNLSERDITKAAGMLIIAYGAGSIIGPLSVPPWLAWFPETGLFLFVAMTAGTYALYGILRLKWMPKVALEDRVSFTALPNLPSAGFQLDPRLDSLDHIKKRIQRKENGV